MAKKRDSAIQENPNKESELEMIILDKGVINWFI